MTGNKVWLCGTLPLNVHKYNMFGPIHMSWTEWNTKAGYNSNSLVWWWLASFKNRNSKYNVWPEKITGSTVTYHLMAETIFVILWYLVEATKSHLVVAIMSCLMISHQINAVIYVPDYRSQIQAWTLGLRGTHTDMPIFTHIKSNVLKFVHQRLGWFHWSQRWWTN